jgi:hypothetical protein
MADTLLPQTDDGKQRRGGLEEFTGRVSNGFEGDGTSISKKNLQTRQANAIRQGSEVLMGTSSLRGSSGGLRYYGESL